MEDIGPIGVLARRLYALVYLQLYPLGLDAKLSTLYSLIGLQEIAISIAIVEDLGIGLQQPILVKGPSQLVIVIKLLLVVVSVQISDILELRDLYIVRPSGIELYILLLYEPKCLYLVLVYIDVSMSLTEVRTLTLVVYLALQLLFSEPLLLLYLPVLMFQVIESVAREVQYIVVGQPLLLAPYIYKRVVELKGLFLKPVNKFLYPLDFIGCLLNDPLCLYIFLLSAFQLAIDLYELFSEVVSLFLEERRVRSYMLVIITSYPLLSVVVLDRC